MTKNTRPARTKPSRSASRIRILTAVTGITLAGSAVLVAGAGVAAADTTSNGPVSGTVSIAVRSLTVSISSAAANNCFATEAQWAAWDQNTANGTPFGALLMPNGFCSTSSFQVTNGGVPGHVDVQGSDATGAGGAATGTWSLTGNTPGADQYNLDTVANPGANLYNTTAAATCDQNFDMGGAAQAAGCTATAGQSSTELIGLEGPSSTSGSATQYDYTTTWTAAP